MQLLFVSMVEEKIYNKHKKIMELEFGKKVTCGNYYILKKSKSLSKKEMKSLRSASNIPNDVAKHLQRGSLPYIKVSTLTESWSVEFVVGMTMYAFIDAVNVVTDADGNRQLYGEEKNTMEHIFVQMMADTTLVGDKEYRLGKLKLQKEFFERESKKLNEEADKGKTEEALVKESEEAVQEIIDRDNHAAKILEIGNEAKEEEENGK